MQRSSAPRRWMGKILPSLVLVTWFGIGSAQAQDPVQPKQWAVIIAIRDYDDPSVQDLNVTLNDAREFKRTLIQRAGVKEENILEMTDDSPPERRPTRINIQNELVQFFSKPEKGDTLLFFY